GKAASLANRGVRRVFAIDVERARAFEWSRELGTWSILDGDASIVDPVFAVPLPVRALLQTAKADDAVAAALLAKRNPVLETALEEAEVKGNARGVQQGERALLLRQLRRRFGDEVNAEVERRVAAASAEQVEMWAVRVLSATTLSGVLAD